MPDERERRISELLQEAAETHHRVYRITDGSDDDWASWYADWLLDLSELPDVLGTKPIRSHLVYALVQCDRDHTAATAAEPWQMFYAERLAHQFGRQLRRVVRAALTGPIERVTDDTTDRVCSALDHVRGG